ncbi:hypothetical protein, partial [Paraburkholderia sp. J67]|uniref:hypothetical protein n=1 Tax=Paraburkholderia sp. J67 TaxID=2805435 RepID=UPI002ABDBF60
ATLIDRQENKKMPTPPEPRRNRRKERTRTTTRKQFPPGGNKFAQFRVLTSTKNPQKADNAKHAMSTRALI